MLDLDRNRELARLRSSLAGLAVDEWPVALWLNYTNESSPLLTKLRLAMQYFVEGR